MKQRSRILLVLAFFILTLLGGCGETALGSSLTTTVVQPTTVVSASTTATVAPSVSTPIPPTTPSLLTNTEEFQLHLAGVSTDVYVPGGLELTQQAQVLVVLHGMKGSGEAMVRDMKQFAEQYKWILFAPTFNYQTDYMNTQVIAQEDPLLLGQLNEMLDDLPKAIGIAIQPKLLVYGFSRGAQLAHRFALLYPERTLAVTTIAAGSYTMPFANLSDINLKVTHVDSKSNLLPFPFGMSDATKISGRPFNRTAFKKVNFWLEVGDQDNKNSDVPRDFDPYQGANRVERAKAFYGALKQVGNNVSLNIYPTVGHSVSAEMRQQACNFFRIIGKLKA